jgi:hypothetical protein
MAFLIAIKTFNAFLFNLILYELRRSCCVQSHNFRLRVFHAYSQRLALDCFNRVIQRIFVWVICFDTLIAAISASYSLERLSISLAPRSFDIMTLHLSVFGTPKDVRRY